MLKARERLRLYAKYISELQRQLRVDGFLVAHVATNSRACNAEHKANHLLRPAALSHEGRKQLAGGAVVRSVNRHVAKMAYLLSKRNIHLTCVSI